MELTPGRGPTTCSQPRRTRPPQSPRDGDLPSEIVCFKCYPKAGMSNSKHCLGRTLRQKFIYGLQFNYDSFIVNII